MVQQSLDKKKNPACGKEGLFSKHSPCMRLAGDFRGKTQA